MGIADKVPSNVRIAVVGLTIPIFTLFGLALLGCVSTSPGIPSLFLFLLKVDAITLRVGYYAVCALDAAGSSTIGSPASRPPGNSSSSESDNLCVTTMGADARELSTKLFSGNTRASSDDVVPVLDLALNLQSSVLIPLVLMAAVLLFFGAVLFTLTKVMQMKLKDPASWQGAMKKAKILKPLTLAMIWLSTLVAFGAAVGSSMGIGALNFIIPVLATNISVTGGNLVQALQYIAFVFCALFGIAATLLLGDPLEKQNPDGDMMRGDGQGDFNMEEKELGYDPSLEGQQPEGQQPLPDEMPEGMDPEEWAQLQEQQQEQQMMQQQEQGYPEGGEYPEGQVPEGQEGQYPEGGYPEGQEGQYPEGDYPGGAEGQQPYAEGAEYGGEGQAEYDEQAYAQQQQQGQPPYPQ